MPEINVISINYDIIADNSMCRLNEEMELLAFPDYGMDIATDYYRFRDKKGHLLKLHGSLNWLYCPGCHRLDLGISEGSTVSPHTVKVLDELFRENPLERRYGRHGSPCVECSSLVRPVMITPTRIKDYRNPHISNVWYGAERMLRRADRAIIIGYSLPEDDVDVIYLLKRGLENIPASRITVVESDSKRRSLKKHPVGKRYRAVFGDVNWYKKGFEQWIKDEALAYKANPK